MRRHISYMKYLLIHKWFVLVASFKYGCSLWRAIVHDASKLLPDEWIPYSRTFYAQDGSKRYRPNDDFEIAWLKHQRRNKHHWQAWVLREDSGGTKPMRMPLKYVREMVSDWAGAGKAITGEWDVLEWYSRNRYHIVLHKDTRRVVDELVGYNADT